MKQKIYQIDAFANKLFEGNPAMVCPLDEWISDDLMQQIAEENNLSETAFFVKTDEKYQLRWFTPKSEVEMCGHAKLASAYVLFECLGYDSETIIFETQLLNNTLYYYFNNKQLKKIVRAKHKEKVIFHFFETDSAIAKKIEILHKNIDLSIGLTILNY